MRIDVTRHSADRYIAVIEGMPAGIALQRSDAQTDLDRAAEALLFCSAPDAPQVLPRATVLSGLARDRSSAAPLLLEVDFAGTAFSEALDAHGSQTPRFGTADLAFFLRMNEDDCASALQAVTLRHAIVRAAAAFAARALLAELGVDVRSFSSRIGSVELRDLDAQKAALFAPLDIETSAVRCPDPQASRLMVEALDAARAAGEPLPGAFCIVATGCVPGLGSATDPACGLAALIAAAVMGAPSVSSVAFGDASAHASDGAFPDCVQADRTRGFTYARNVQGGVAGGMSTGVPIVCISTVLPCYQGEHILSSIDLTTLEQAASPDALGIACLAPFSSVCAESAVACVLAEAYVRTFGEGPLSDVSRALDAYRARIKTASR